MSIILGRTKSVARSFGFAASEPSKSSDVITYGGDGHLVTFAPTGTGKTAGPVIVNALTHPGQLIVIDIKGEVHAATAQARKAMGQEVHVLDLRDGTESGSLNPLDLVARCGTDLTAMSRSFAAELIERGADERDRFWNDWAESMVTAGTTWLLADCEPEKRRLSELHDLFTYDDAVYRIAVMIDTKAVREKSAKAAFAAFLQLPDRDTRPCVLGSRCLTFAFLNPTWSAGSPIRHP